MKIDGLTLGDWIEGPRKGRTGQVCCIVPDEYCEVETYNSDKGYAGGGCHSGRIEDFAPIPLTREMLLANGFTKFVDGYRRTFYKYVVDNNLMLDISDWEDEGLKIAVGGKFRELKYVHELQHILRLIGLSEVANNFKIK